MLCWSCNHGTGNRHCQAKQPYGCNVQILQTCGCRKECHVQAVMHGQVSCLQDWAAPTWRCFCTLCATLTSVALLQACAWLQALAAEHNKLCTVHVHIDSCTMHSMLVNHECKLKQTACTGDEDPTSCLKKIDDWSVLESISHLTESPSVPITTVQCCKPYCGT